MQTLAEHWDGSAWSVVPSPNPSSGNNTLNSVAAISANDAWAVGSSSGGPIALHWDGSTWSSAAVPSAGSLTGVSAVASNDVWAVGNAPQNLLLTVHWNGASWAVVPCPSPGSNYANSL